MKAFANEEHTTYKIINQNIHEITPKSNFTLVPVQFSQSEVNLYQFFVCMPCKRNDLTSRIRLEMADRSPSCSTCNLVEATWLHICWSLPGRYMSWSCW